MEAITLIDALMCELDPYTVSPKVCIKALMDNGVSDHSVSYDPDKDKVVVAKAAILCLKKLVVLSSDNLGKSSQGYNTTELKNRVKSLCKQCGEDYEDVCEASSITDGSNFW